MKDEGAMNSGGRVGDNPLFSIYVLIGFVAALIVGSMGYVFYVGNRMVATHTPLVNAAMEIKLEATTGHLWFEEILGGDSFESFDNVLAHIDSAEWYAKAMLEGGEGAKGTCVPLRDPYMRQEITQVRIKLAEFRKITVERWETRKTAVAGTEIDQKYDAVFRDFIEQADRVERELRYLIERNLRSFRIVQIVLIGICVSVTAIVGGAFGRFERRRMADERELEASETQLRAANQQLLAGEKELESVNEQLRQSEADLIKAQEVASVGSWKLNVSSNELTCSKQTCRMFGVQGGTGLTYRMFLSYVHPEDRAFVDGCWMAAMKGKGFDIEHRIVIDEEVKWIIEKAEADFDEEGKAVFVTGTLEDITERKRAETAISESEEKFRSIAEQSIVGIMITQDGKFRYVNQAVSEILEYPVEEIMSWGVKEGYMKIVLPADRGLVMEQERRKQAGENDIVAHYAWKALTRRRRIRCVETYWKPVSFQGNRANLVTMLDITERDRAEKAFKRAEEALRNSEERFRRFSECAFEGIFMHDNGRIIDANKALAVMSGYELSELIGMDGLGLIVPEDRELIAKNLQSEFDKPYEVTGLRKDGLMVPLEIQSKKVSFKGQQVMVVAVRDLTERKEAQEEMLSLAKFPDENPKPVLRMSMKGTILYANNASGPILETWGCKKGEHLPGEWGKRVEAALGSGEAASYELACGNDDVFLVTLAPVNDAGYVNAYGVEVAKKKALQF